MTTAFGPQGPNFTTVRPPADPQASAGADTFFKNCSAPGAKDGTFATADFFNVHIANIRFAVREAGVPLSDADDEMLYKAIYNIASNILSSVDANQQIKAAAATQPTHLEITANGGMFVFTTTVGSFTINDAQVFVWRGLVPFLTTDITIGNRTFATAASKTYHLRWHAPGTNTAVPAATYPRGRFVLQDCVSGGAYNPSGLAESSSAFDGAYDDALIARVTTNPSNFITITPLVNKAILKGAYSDSSFTFGAAPAGTLPTPTGSPRIIFTLNDAAGACASQFTINWSRTPAVNSLTCGVGLATPPNESTHVQGTANYISGRTITRYDVYMLYYTDWDSSILSGGAVLPIQAYAYARADILA